MIEEADTYAGEGRPKRFKLVLASAVLFIMPFMQFHICVACLLAYTPRSLFLLACILLGPALGILTIFRIRKSKGLAVKVMVIYIAVLALVICGYLVAMGDFSPEDCAWNVRAISLAMLAYAEDNDGKFPTADNWCDLLIQHTDLDREEFICKSAKQGPSNYAINPNATTTSPDNMVLLFETKGGWNQSGGPELLTVDNHGGQGCTVLFVNEYTGFVETRWIGALKWKIEDYDNSQSGLGVE